MTSTAPTSAQPSKRQAWRAMAVASLATITATLPIFQVGALAVQITSDLMFGVAALGTAAGLTEGTRAVLGAAVGRLVDRLGAIPSLRIGVTLSAVASFGIATMTTSWATLVAWMLLAGVGHTFTQPASNRYMMSQIDHSSLGLAFGIKQAGPPFSTMVAGLSVPLIALTFGWRWSYALAGFITIGVLFFIPRAGEPRKKGAWRKDAKAPLAPLKDRSTLVICAVGFCLTMFASRPALTFAVDSAVKAGMAERIAGLMFAVASIATIITRIAAGIAADRTNIRPFTLAAGMLGCGAVGLAMLASGIPALMAAGTIIALAGTWGFPSVFWLGLMSAYPNSPGRATGAMAVPIFIGGGTGPIVFGWVVEQVGYQIAWTATVGASVASAIILGWSGRRFAQRAALRAD